MPKKKKGQALVYNARYQQEIDAAKAAQAAAEAAAAQQAAKEAEFTSRGLPYVNYTPTGRWCGFLSMVVPSTIAAPAAAT